MMEGRWREGESLCFVACVALYPFSYSGSIPIYHGYYSISFNQLLHPFH
jgi:hypothetical protein